MRLGWKSLPYNIPMTPNRFVFLAHEFFLQEPHTSAIPEPWGWSRGGRAHIDHDLLEVVLVEEHRAAEPAQSWPWGALS